MIVASSGCTKPSSVATDSITTGPGTTGSLLTSGRESTATADALYDTENAVESPIALVAFDDSPQPSAAAADALQQKPAQRPKRADAADIFRSRMQAFSTEARTTATLLEKHGSTDSFDQQCAKLKDLLDRARSADDDDQFYAVIQHANLIVQQLRLGRSYLLQRDDLEGQRSPGAVKILRDIYRACGQLAQQEQQEIASLRREVELR